MSLPRRLIEAALSFALVLTLVPPASAQDANASAIEAARDLLAKESYVRPPEVIQKLVTAPRHLNVSLTQPSPDRRYFLKEKSEGLPSVTAFGKPHFYFAGLQVDPAANRARALTTRGAVGLSLIDATTGASTTIETPKNATVSGTSWSPDGKQLAYIANFETASQVFVADLATRKSVQVTKTPLLATLVTSVDWTVDGKNVVVVLVPEPRAAQPKKPAIATGPQVRVWTDGKQSAQRNFWSLLEEPFDRDLMEWFVTGQLAVIDVKSKAVRKVGSPAMIRSVDASPDGQYFRVSTMQKPFSYVVQYSSFGTTEEVWDGTGKVLATIEKRALREAPDSGDTGFGGRAGGEGARRALAWMPSGTGLYYLASDAPARGDSSATPATVGGRAGGAGRGGAGGGNNRPDRLIKWNPPFGESDTTTLYRHTGPLSGVLFTDDAKMVFGAATANNQGEIFAVRLDDPARRYTVVRQRGYTPSLGGGGGRFGGGGRGGAVGDDTLAFYNNPGTLVTKRGSAGGQVAMLTADSAVFMRGTQYFRDFLQNAPRDFVDRVDIRTGTKSRLFEAAKDAVETVAVPLDDEFTKAIVVRESASEVANSYLRDLKSGAMTRLTNNVDPSPDYTRAVRKRVVVTRPDGISFVVKVTLPADYREGTRLPGMFWLYPYEYTSQAEYDRTLRTENVNQFPAGGTRTIEYLATQGYAVANFNPPIMGETGRMNDNYVSDLRMNLYAVIDELDRQGWIDRTRLGIGGHSYGAFTTANALVHTPFFKAGIAGDGMYNRTLTPTGFQSERRDLWDGQGTYLELSPMLYVDQMQGALLMYHALEDQNVGTNPISSIRMMQALRAQGKTAALYMYPYEDHGPATEETLLDLWGRWTAWLDIYVKNAGKKPTKIVQ
ncbi:MAG TPA: prolyl oligopeptidase family serine peptidase [Gemmatimonadaceae bacterium]